jgi:hypothetical protein
MKRIAMFGAVLGVLSVAGLANAQCACNSPVAATSYYVPGTSASVVTGSPMPSAVTATSFYAPTTTYYAPEVVTSYYAPTTAYYAPTTAYYAPATTVYSPYTYSAYYAPAYPVYVAPRRGLFRRW